MSFNVQKIYRTQNMKSGAVKLPQNNRNIATAVRDRQQRHFISSVSFFFVVQLCLLLQSLFFAVRVVLWSDLGWGISCLDI